jgi:hypothetical protein
MKFLVDKIDKLSDTVWLAPLPLADARRIGTPRHAKKGCSVVLLPATCVAKDDWISFEPETATLLNLGTVDFTVFIGAEASKADVTERTKSGYASVRAQCLKHLPRDLADRAVAMLDEIAGDSSDDLISDKTNRWISRPDNYFTIKVQPQNKDLVVTIRGRPDEYESKIVDLRADQNGYTRFWIRRLADVSEALRLIRSARQRGRLRQ